MTTESKIDFWNSRGKLEKNPGSNDFPLKHLEVQKLLEVVTKGATVLDIGCGDGETLEALATGNGCTGKGLDFSEAMVEAARRRLEASSAPNALTFGIGKLPDLPEGLATFDFVITERCLINLASIEEQHAAFRNIMKHVRPGGRYLMCESFIQGLEKSNELRNTIGLEPIAPPWHNVFVDEVAAASWETPEFRLVDRQPFTSTYHFLSRVVYAKLAADRGEQLRYDSDINMLSLKLPPIGDCGPVRLWIWERT